MPETSSRATPATASRSVWRATSNQVLGNYIGTDINGTADLGNTFSGVSINDAIGNTIGGTTTGARNVISGNDFAGIDIVGAGASGNVVLGNYIGTDSNGTADLGNSFDGVNLSFVAGSGTATPTPSGNIIGGATIQARNIISGNDRFGIVISAPGGGGSNNLIQGNYIGTDVNGTSDLGNGDDGVVISSSGSTISGTASGNQVLDNVISGNEDDGIQIEFDQATNNLVAGNFIGTDITGTVALGNVNSGVRIVAAPGNMIGGTVAGAGNVIAMNGGPGVAVQNSLATGNSILGNSIYSNTGLGIDLGDDGPTLNDTGPGDLDAGPNNFQNFPVLTSAVSSGGTTTIQGTLNSTPSTSFRVELFNDAGDPSGYGEGRVFLGFTTVTTDANGDASFTATVPTPPTPLLVYTATATVMPSPGLYTDTSEFSATITLDADLAVSLVDPPDPVGVGQDLTYTVTVTNNGPHDALGVVLADMLPTGVTFVSAVPSQGTATQSGGVVTASLGSLTPGAFATVTIIVQPTITGTITNTVNVTSTSNDPDPTNNTASESTLVELPGTLEFSLANFTVAENIPGGVALITVTRTGGAGGTVMVAVTSADGTATAGIDYLPLSPNPMILTFGPGVTTQTFPIQILDDGIDENDETVLLSLSSPTEGAFLGTQSTAVLTIVDDDTTTATIDDVTVIEGDTGTTPAVFTVTLSTPSDRIITIDYATADGTAIAGVDYQATSGTLTFDPGQTTQTITVLVFGDVVDELDETFFVNLSNATQGGQPAPGLITRPTGIGTIVDDDTTTATIDDVTVLEGDSGTIPAVFTVTLSTPSDRIITIDYATADGTAIAGLDYQAISGTLTFDPGQTTQTITVLVFGDVVDELDETFFVNLSNATQGGQPAPGLITRPTGIGTIVDDDTTTATIDDVTVLEGDSGTIPAVFTVTLSTPSDRIITIDYATADGTAIAGLDYQATSGTLTFDPGQTIQTITVLVFGDVVDELDETFFVNLSNATQGGQPAPGLITRPTGIGTIVDDDTTTATIDDVTVLEGDSGTIPAVFTVTLSTPSDRIITIDYATADGTAIAGVDYQATSGTLTFDPGQTTQTITVLVFGDVVDELDETFFVNLSNATQGGQPAPGLITRPTGIGTIVDDDTTTATIDDVTVLEGDSGTIPAVFTVTLSTPSDRIITIDYATADGTAIAGVDYQATSGTLTFDPGQTITDHHRPGLRRLPEGASRDLLCQSFGRDPGWGAGARPHHPSHGGRHDRR